MKENKIFSKHKYSTGNVRIDYIMNEFLIELFKSR